MKTLVGSPFEDDQPAKMIEALKRLLAKANREVREMKRL